MKFAELTLTGVSIKFRTSLAGNSCLITPSNHQKNSARVPRWIRIGASEARMVLAWIYMQKKYPPWAISGLVQRKRIRIDHLDGGD
jgi:hypothetical protein